jgi:hypothetical protein
VTCTGLVWLLCPPQIPHELKRAQTQTLFLAVCNYVLTSVVHTETKVPVLLPDKQALWCAWLAGAREGTDRWAGCRLHINLINKPWFLFQIPSLAHKRGSNRVRRISRCDVVLTWFPNTFQGVRQNHPSFRHSVSLQKPVSGDFLPVLKQRGGQR